VLLNFVPSKKHETKRIVKFVLLAEYAFQVQRINLTMYIGFHFIPLQFFQSHTSVTKSSQL